VAQNGVEAYLIKSGARTGITKIMRNEIEAIFRGSAMSREVKDYGIFGLGLLDLP